MRSPAQAPHKSLCSLRCRRGAGPSLRVVRSVVRRERAGERLHEQAEVRPLAELAIGLLRCLQRRPGRALARAGVQGGQVGDGLWDQCDEVALEEQGRGGEDACDGGESWGV